jgi:hypothetical protein
MGQVKHIIFMLRRKIQSKIHELFYFLILRKLAPIHGLTINEEKMVFKEYSYAEI